MKVLFPSPRLRGRPPASLTTGRTWPADVHDNEEQSAVLYTPVLKTHNALVHVQIHTPTSLEVAARSVRKYGKADLGVFQSIQCLNIPTFNATPCKLFSLTVLKIRKMLYYRYRNGLSGQSNHTDSRFSTVEHWTHSQLYSLSACVSIFLAKKKMKILHRSKYICMEVYPLCNALSRRG